jgi:superfamily I DNA and RNA helicase
MSAPYRQSDKLNELAKLLAAASSGPVPDTASAGYTHNEGFRPVAGKEMSNPSKLIAWLAERIIEIENSVGTLPSIAIFVIDEEQVRSVSEALNHALVGKNIPVVACRDGLALGQDNNVRVFNVEHIKGLEFEAVFFIGVDALERKFPELFDKYLYVGTTRAATYLGLTCDGSQFPGKIRPIEPLFASTWKPST